MKQKGVAAGQVKFEADGFKGSRVTVALVFYWLVVVIIYIILSEPYLVNGRPNFL